MELSNEPKEKGDVMEGSAERHKSILQLLQKIATQEPTLESDKLMSLIANSRGEVADELKPSLPQGPYRADDDRS